MSVLQERERSERGDMGDEQARPKFLRPTRRLCLGTVGGGRGALSGEIHAMGARISDRYELVAGALSSDPDRARESGRD